MRYLILVLSVILGLSSCKAQKKVALEELFITEFVKRNKDNGTLFVNNKLYVLGFGKNFSTTGIEIIRLELDKVKEKANSEGEFNLVSINDIYLENSIIKTFFRYLTAKKDNESLTYQHGFNEIYCIKYNCETKRYEVFWCGTPHGVSKN